MHPVTLPLLSLLSKHRGEGDVYVTSVSVSGGATSQGGVSGLVRSDDGALELALGMPPELGGHGGGTHSEQLFAAGYAACFHGSLMLLAMRRRIAADRIEVAVSVHFRRDPSDGLFMLATRVQVRMPGTPRVTALELMRNAERVCPYTKMAREGFENTVTLVEHGG